MQFQCWKHWKQLTRRVHDMRGGVRGKLRRHMLGERGVNVRRLELGRASAGELAHGFLGLDEVPDDELLDALLAIEAIEEVRLVRF